MTENTQPESVMNERMIESAQATVADIRRVDEKINELTESVQKWRAERRKFVKFVRTVEQATGREFLPKQAKKKGGKRGRRRDPNSLGSLILKALGDTDKANAAKLEKRVEDEGYAFNGKTKPYARIHSELQRLKKSGLVESADERGFYQLASQPEPETSAVTDEPETETSDGTETETSDDPISGALEGEIANGFLAAGLAEEVA